MYTLPIYPLRSWSGRPQAHDPKKVLRWGSSHVPLRLFFNISTLRPNSTLVIMSIVNGVLSPLTCLNGRRLSLVGSLVNLPEVWSEGHEVGSSTIFV